MLTCCKLLHPGVNFINSFCALHPCAQLLRQSKASQKVGCRAQKLGVRAQNPLWNRPLFSAVNLKFFPTFCLKVFRERKIWIYQNHSCWGEWQPCLSVVDIFYLWWQKYVFCRLFELLWWPWGLYVGVTTTRSPRLLVCSRHLVAPSCTWVIGGEGKYVLMALPQVTLLNGREFREQVVAHRTDHLEPWGGQVGSEKHKKKKKKKPKKKLFKFKYSSLFPCITFTLNTGK